MVYLSPTVIIIIIVTIIIIEFIFIFKIIIIIINTYYDHRPPHHDHHHYNHHYNHHDHSHHHHHYHDHHHHHHLCINVSELRPHQDNLRKGISITDGCDDPQLYQSLLYSDQSGPDRGILRGEPITIIPATHQPSTREHAYQWQDAGGHLRISSV